LVCRGLLSICQLMFICTFTGIQARFYVAELC
jgi:hypothetical protein